MLQVTALPGGFQHLVTSRRNPGWLATGKKMVSVGENKKPTTNPLNPAIFTADSLEQKRWGAGPENQHMGKTA